jgi:hypothetical protein
MKFVCQYRKRVCIECKFYAIDIKMNLVNNL